jgi:DNA invertase Pin-like site-specific DNA recombinase
VSWIILLERVSWIILLERVSWIILLERVSWIILRVGGGSMIPTGIHLIALIFPLVGLAQTRSSHNTAPSNKTISDFTQTSDIDSNDDDGSSEIKRATKTAYAYLRQSQTSEDENADESSSIQSQKQTTNETARERGYDDLRFFRDVNESGFSFEREGFQTLTEALKREPRPVFLDRIDRLGRDTLETVYVAAKIHYNYEVPLITAQHGEYELDKIDDQLDLVLNAIIAGKSVKNRVRAAWKSIKMRFGEERKWYSWFNKIPVGYHENDEGWIEPSPHASEVITAIIQDLLSTENRKKTAERVGSVANNESLDSTLPDNEDSLASIDSAQIRSAFEGSDYDPNNFTASQLKHLVTHSILIGEVRYPRKSPPEEQNVIEDSDLQLIDQDLFEKINSFIEEEADKNSTDSEKNVDIETLADLGLLPLAVEETDVIKPVCPNCNRGMVKNGEDNEHPLEDGRVAHYWMCPKYRDHDASENHVQRKVPYNREWEALQNYLEGEHTDKSEILALKICPPER